MNVFGIIGAYLMGTAQPGDWVVLLSKLGFCALIVVGALVAQRVLGRVIHTRLFGQASEVTLFETFVRVAIWLIAIAIILEPLTGLETSGLVATLGIGTMVISLGLQDTVANLVSGIQLTGHHVIVVGDHIEVGQYRGEVIDVTWRETTIRDLNGDIEVIPNSQLNKTTLVKLSHDNGYRHLFEVEVRPDADLDAVAAEICAKADAALDAAGIRQEGMPTKAFFLGATAYGITCSIRIYVRREEDTTPGRDAVMRAIKQSPWLSDCTNAA